MMSGGQPNPRHEAGWNSSGTEDSKRSVGDPEKENQRSSKN